MRSESCSFIWHPKVRMKYAGVVAMFRRSVAPASASASDVCEVLRREKQAHGSASACTPVRQGTQPNRKGGTKYSAEPCRREGAYQERTCPTERAHLLRPAFPGVERATSVLGTPARRSFFARRTLPTLLVEALALSRSTAE